VHVIREAGGVSRIEMATMMRNYRWDWAHLVPALREAGFARAESHRFRNIHGSTYSLNLAYCEG
jgi:hypothetical protein